MVGTVSSTAAVAAGLALLVSPSLAQGFYAKGSPVLELASKREYDTLIARSNHTSIVEFYAPWCGHCRNLKPAYEKAAKSLAGLAKVAAVNCDEESNKQFCSEAGVQGFPTLKIVKPGKVAGKPRMEDYQGPRTAKGISDAVKDKITNHAKRLTDDTLSDWLMTDNSSAKAILFSTKGATSALIKALAIDYLGAIHIAQARDKEKAVSGMFGITTYPSLVLLPGGEKPFARYSGDMTKTDMSNFLSTAAEPNPDPAPAANSKPKTAAAKDNAAGQIPVVPSELPVPTTLPSLSSVTALRDTCLSSKSGICVLVLAPAGIKSADLDTLAESHPMVAETVKSLAEVHHGQTSRGATVPPFYIVTGPNILASELRAAAILRPEEYMDIVAINGKRGWLKRYHATSTSEEGYTKQELSDWIEAIKMGEGKKEKLTDGLIEDSGDGEAPVGTGAEADADERAEVEASTDYEPAAAEMDDDSIPPPEPSPPAEPKVGSGTAAVELTDDEIALLSDEEVERLMLEQIKPEARRPAEPKAPDHGEL